MSIVYALITKGLDKVLCEYTEYQGNFQQVSRSLMKKVQKEHRATFSYDDATFLPSEIENAISYSLNETFKEIMIDQIEHFNKNIHIEDGLDNLKKEVLDSKEMIIRSSEVLSQREDKINLVVIKTITGNPDSGSYFENARIIRREIRMKRLKLVFFSILVFLLIGYFISIIFCGFDYEGCRSE